MEIKVLGPGCANCKKLEDLTLKALAELGLEPEVEKITDVKEISKYALITPGLMIDGMLNHSGLPLPSIDKIKNWILEAE